MFFTQNGTKFRISSFDPSGTSTINSPFPSSVFKPMRYKQIKYTLNNTHAGRQAGSSLLPFLPPLPASFNITSNVFFCYVSGVHNFQNGEKRSEGEYYNFSERRHSLFALSNAPQIFIMNVNHRVLKSNDCLFLLHVQFHPRATLFSPALPNFALSRDDSMVQECTTSLFTQMCNLVRG